MMTVTLCPSRVSAAGRAPTTSDSPPLVANGCISDAIITIRRLSLSARVLPVVRGAAVAPRWRRGFAAARLITGFSAVAVDRPPVGGFGARAFVEEGAFRGDLCPAPAGVAPGSFAAAGFASRV